MGFGFSLVDVFSDRPFGGNQLAVFPDAAGIPDGTMQQLAREFNFSETTFVLPPRDPSCTCWVRIFTPGRELPFAGHPTLGTAAVLASLSEEEPGEQQFVFEEGIGPVTVAVDGQVIRLHLRSPRYESTGEAPQAAAIAKALTLPEDAIAESWYAGAVDDLLDRGERGRAGHRALPVSSATAWASSPGSRAAIRSPSRWEQVIPAACMKVASPGCCAQLASQVDRSRLASSRGSPVPPASAPVSCVVMLRRAGSRPPVISPVPANAAAASSGWW
jgi:hypothetical protein